MNITNDRAEDSATTSSGDQSDDDEQAPAEPAAETASSIGDDPDEQEQDDDEDEDGDDDEEPALKYARLEGEVPKLFVKDSASALAISQKDKRIVLGTHAGVVHILDLNGTRIKSYKKHLASITDIALDEDFIATASMDGHVIILSLTTAETQDLDMRRPVRTVALEPEFSKHATRAFVCGGLAGTLVHRERGWLGPRDTVLHAGEGPVWQARWRGRLVAWANDLGVKIYDTTSRTRITFIDRPADSPRADLFRCTLHWQDDATLLIAWADLIKVARIRARPAVAGADASALFVEITAVFQLDCMAAGILPHPMPSSPSVVLDDRSISSQQSKTRATRTLTSFLVLAYYPPDTSILHADEATADSVMQKRKAAERPELRIISRSGEELANDALSVAGYQSWQCNDYALAKVGNPSLDAAADGDQCYVILSPRDIVIAKPRDARDHIGWLVERERYEEALEDIDELSRDSKDPRDEELNTVAIGHKYIDYLVRQGEFEKAARLCPKVCGHDSKRWEHWAFVFAEKRHLEAVIPLVPTDAPRLDPVVYGMILGYLLSHDRRALVRTIQVWPRDIYDIPAVIVAVQADLDRAAYSAPSGPETRLLMETLGELYVANRQPGKALGYFLRLRRPDVFDLIKEHNLYTDVQDQALLLVEFDAELMKRRRADGETADDRDSEAIRLLVDHVHSIPTVRVVQQLESRPYFLFLYLSALLERDPHVASDFGDLLVKLFAEHDASKLISFLRASSEYNLEMAYNVCKERDLVPEMVFLLGQMGDNKKALTLIIERLGDVNRAIDFAKEQNDHDLWEDLLKYSETRPAFIRGLLENVGPEIDPIRLIRRIKNGLEIPGLKEALIKILQDFHLQISLLEGCQTILNGDNMQLSRRLQSNQTSGFFLTGKSTCPVCEKPLQDNSQGVVLLFFCRHMAHASCIEGGDHIPVVGDTVLRNVGMGSAMKGMSGKIAFESTVRARILHGCPLCHRRAEGQRT
ncbi:hypothetical protein BD626DRAFT_393164 [Schizophyllum amplum]|uniref:Vacuolar protein sorting-associated protein 41 n=1 Tax=Schizophyllum amplum TaxID=97359 RepID=A0A550CYG7_9AGAR|nr:hypothetical protein BD626DRAFT_393164 [Auriculariopsis ampla]